MPKIMTELNAGQAEAVEMLQGPLLILAGAGTGKTKTLTARVAKILTERLAFPSQILSLTFTNKAAAEMRSRVLAQAQVEAMPWLGTFHSICAKMLRMMLKNLDGTDFGLGISDTFLIVDSSDQKRIIKEMLKAHNLDEKRYPPNLMLHFISSWKDSALVPAAGSGGASLSSQSDGEAVAAKIWTGYQKRLAALDAVDFGDLLNFCVQIFRSHPKELERWQNKFKFILVDEYQDTNHVQHILLKLLAGAQQNICCVGDDDQSIYSWRGAEVKNILEFEKTFTDPKIIRLEQNYRSTKHILAGADNLIAHNQARLGKKLWTDADDGSKIAIWECVDGREEAQKISAKVVAAHKQGIALRSMAILVRTSAQIRLFEEQAIALTIPYRIIGSLRFYERAEIRDANAYFRLILEPRDDLALRRIINQPKRQLGNRTIDLLAELATRENCSMFAAAELDKEQLAAGQLKPRAIAALKAFTALINGMRSKQSTMALDEFADLVLEDSELMTMWRAQKEAGQTQLDNLNELKRALSEFPSLGEYLEHIALVIDNEGENADRANQDYLSMMTLHAAKGLEFDHVFLPGWEEGLFPHQRSLDEALGVEEERRLAYVGLTRARETAIISFVRMRLMFNDWLDCLPSRFIGEIGETDSIFHRASGAGTRANAHPRAGATQTQSAETPSAETQSAETQSAVARRVHHEVFGQGTITATSGDNLSIRFDDGARKMIKANFVEFI